MTENPKHHLESLALAHQLQTQRRAWRRWAKAADPEVAAEWVRATILNPPQEMHSMPVRDLLCKHLRNIGDERAQRLADRARRDHDLLRDVLWVRLDELVPRERRALAEAVEYRTARAVDHQRSLARRGVAA